MTLPAPELPALFHLADGSAVRAQRVHFRYLASLGAVSVAAAVFGSLDLDRGAVDLAALVAAALFAVQLLLLVVLAHAKHDETWYESRAAAESLRTMAWRFGVCGEPFPASLDEPTAARALSLRSREVLREMRGPVLPVASGDDDALPASLVAARREALATRRALYLDARIGDQQRWYRSKAASQERLSRRFLRVLMSVAATGVVLSLSQAVGVLPGAMDTAGIAAAMVGAILAYTQSRQYAVQSRAYLLTQHELALLRHETPSGDDEAEWARWVADAEEAISREHTMWLASRGRTTTCDARAKAAATARGAAREGG